MADVVAQIKDSLALEYARENNRRTTASVVARDSAVSMMSSFWSIGVMSPYVGLFGSLFDGGAKV
jgi:biopolymer transport protein ExbB/TolQ